MFDFIWKILYIIKEYECYVLWQKKQLSQIKGILDIGSEVLRIYRILDKAAV